MFMQWLALSERERAREYAGRYEIERTSGGKYVVDESLVPDQIHRLGPQAEDERPFSP